MLLPCQTHCTIFIMSPRDMEFSLMRYRSLVKGAIRLPIVFSRLNVLLHSKKQAKVTYCVKLAILNSRCPEETHITNFTRMPHQHHDNDWEQADALDNRLLDQNAPQLESHHPGIDIHAIYKWMLTKSYSSAPFFEDFSH